MTRPLSLGSTRGPDPRLRLILFGGGHGDDSRDAERLFGEGVGQEGSVLMLAAPGRHPVDVDCDADRLAGHLREVGVPRLTIRDAAFPDLPPFAVISFSASLPHEIVPLLRSSGLDAAMVDAARAGCVIYATGQLPPILGPIIRYTAIRDYDIRDHGITDNRGLGLTTDVDGNPAIYMGRYRALPSSNRRHPQRVANETGARVCATPPMSVVAICDGEVRESGSRSFAWFDPKPRRAPRHTVDG